jgi:hypothetical protein
VRPYGERGGGVAVGGERNQVLSFDRLSYSACPRSAAGADRAGLAHSQLGGQSVEWEWAVQRGQDQGPPGAVSAGTARCRPGSSCRCRAGRPALSACGRRTITNGCSGFAAHACSHLIDPVARSGRRPCARGSVGRTRLRPAVCGVIRQGRLGASGFEPAELTVWVDSAFWFSPYTAASTEAVHSLPSRARSST